VLHSGHSPAPGVGIASEESVMAIEIKRCFV